VSPVEPIAAGPAQAVAAGAQSGPGSLGALAPGAAPRGEIEVARSFASLLTAGLEDLQQKTDRADALVRAFAVDDTVPVHEVTIALEEARLAVELALQVRNRLVDGYRELMNMQL
jgi:flagellar hook-basal body complex protein FliE